MNQTSCEVKHNITNSKLKQESIWKYSKKTKVQDCVLEVLLMT